MSIKRGFAGGVWLLVVVLSGALLAAAQGDREPDYIAGEDASGMTVTMQLGEVLLVQLRANPTTGYVWQWDLIGVEVLGEPVDRYVPDPGDADGAGGTQSWAFEAIRPGTARLLFGELPPDEGAEPIYSYELTIVVEAPPTSPEATDEPGQRVVSLTEASHRQPVELAVGDTLKIVLHDNPATGYEWERYYPPPAPIAQADVTVIEVLPDSPAAEADFQPGDVILTVNEQAVAHTGMFESLLDAPRDEPLLVVVARQGEQIELPLSLGDYEPEMTERAQIVNVLNGSPADEADLAVDDVIVAIDGESLASVNQFIETVADHDGEPVTLTVVRGTRQLEIPVTPRAEVDGVARIGAGVIRLPLSAAGLIAANHHIVSGEPDSEADDAILASLGEPEYIPASSDAVGAGGMSVWQFEAASPGEVALVLVYQRPGTANISRVFAVQVTVD